MLWCLVEGRAQRPSVATQASTTRQTECEAVYNIKAHNKTEKSPRYPEV